jgi:hypothetical protein
MWLKSSAAPRARVMTFGIETPSSGLGSFSAARVARRGSRAAIPDASSRWTAGFGTVVESIEAHELVAPHSVRGPLASKESCAIEP